MENKLKRSKKFSVYLLDFFTCFILTLIFFFIGESINISLPYYQQQVDNINLMQDDLTNLVVESKLSYLKEDKHLAQTEDVSKDYIIKKTYIVIDEDKRNNDIFKNVKDDEDNLYFYYQTYITSHQNEYSDFSKLINVDQYIDKLYKGVKNEENNIFTDETCQYFTKETADRVYDYLVNNNSNYLSIYQIVYDTYLTILEDTINQYMELFNPYVNLVNQYNNEIDSYYQIKIFILLICYFISINIIYLLIPCIFKDGRTLFMKLFNLKAITVENEKVTWPFILIKTLCLLIIYMFMVSLVALIVLGGYNGILLLFTYFFDIFNLFSLSILSILLVICSGLFTFVKKEKKQTFSELISMIIVVEDDAHKNITVGGKTYTLKQ